MFCLLLERGAGKLRADIFSSDTDCINNHREDLLARSGDQERGNKWKRILKRLQISLESRAVISGFRVVTKGRGDREPMFRPPFLLSETQRLTRMVSNVLGN